MRQSNRALSGRHIYILFFLIPKPFVRPPHVGDPALFPTFTLFRSRSTEAAKVRIRPRRARSPFRRGSRWRNSLGSLRESCAGPRTDLTLSFAVDARSAEQWRRRGSREVTGRRKITINPSARTVGRGGSGLVWSGMVSCFSSRVYQSTRVSPVRRPG